MKFKVSKANYRVAIRMVTRKILEDDGLYKAYEQSIAWYFTNVLFNAGFRFPMMEQMARLAAHRFLQEWTTLKQEGGKTWNR